YMSIIVPMVLVNVMGAIANLETAAAVGDKYDPLACVFGAVPWLIGTIPIASGVGFLLWIGMVITSSSFERKAHDSNHGTAVVLGMIPALAAWAFQLVQTTLHAVNTNSNMTAALDSLAAAGLNPQGMIALSQGYLLTAIVLASTMVHIIERDFIYAAAWMAVASMLSATGIIHAYRVVGNAIEPALGFFPTQVSHQFAIVYAGMALMLAAFHLGEEEYKYTWSHVLKMVTWSKQRLPRHAPAAASIDEHTPLLLRSQSTLFEMEK
ncbi:hypothetical protein DYB31_015749, partial [Aphanomyces astaci]